MQFDRGFLSPYFVTDAEKMIADRLRIPTSSFTRRSSSSLKDHAAASSKQVVQVRQAAADCRRGRRGRGARNACRQQIRGGLKVAAVKAPGFGDRRKAMLEDIAVLTGGQVDLRGARHQAGERQARTCSAEPSGCVIDKENTTIIDGAGEAKGHRRPHRQITARDREDDQRLRP